MDFLYDAFKKKTLERLQSIYGKDLVKTHLRVMDCQRVKFIYSEKATKFCEISSLLLTGTTLNKSKVEISQNFVAFLEYMNFKAIFFLASNFYMISSSYFFDKTVSPNVKIAWRQCHFGHKGQKSFL